MSQKNLSNQAAAVAARLLQRSRSTGEDHQALLTRYGLERLLRVALQIEKLFVRVSFGEDTGEHTLGIKISDNQALALRDHIFIAP